MHFEMGCLSKEKVQDDCLCQKPVLCARHELEMSAMPVEGVVKESANVALSSSIGAVSDHVKCTNFASTSKKQWW